MDGHRCMLATLFCTGVATFAQASVLAAQELPELTMRLDADRKVVWAELGPVALPANLGYGDVAIDLAGAGEFPLDGWLHRFEVVLVDGAGERLDDQLLHHLAVFAPGERDLASPLMRRIVAFGMETGTVRVPRPLGYPVRAGDSLLINAAVFNPTARAIDSVFVRLRIAYEPGGTRSRALAVMPFYLDVGPEPGSSTFDVPPGRLEASVEWTPDVPGHVLGLGGHLHRYGVALVLEDVTAGRALWRARPRLGPNGDVVGMPRKLFNGRGLRIEPGRVYRLTAIYENPTDQVVRGAMGKLAGLFVPDAGWSLPTADRADPLYRRDRAAQTAMGGHRHHH